MIQTIEWQMWNRFFETDVTLNFRHQNNPQNSPNYDYNEYGQPDNNQNQNQNNNYDYDYEIPSRNNGNENPDYKEYQEDISDYQDYEIPESRNNAQNENKDGKTFFGSYSKLPIKPPVLLNNLV